MSCILREEKGKIFCVRFFIYVYNCVYIGYTAFGRHFTGQVFSLVAGVGPLPRTPEGLWSGGKPSYRVLQVGKGINGWGENK